jgi:hypothetical protein
MVYKKRVIGSIDNDLKGKNEERLKVYFNTSRIQKNMRKKRFSNHKH